MRFGSFAARSADNDSAAMDEEASEGGNGVCYRFGNDKRMKA
jgi:hypothetical protein